MSPFFLNQKPELTLPAFLVQQWDLIFTNQLHPYALHITQLQLKNKQYVEANKEFHVFGEGGGSIQLSGENCNGTSHPWPQHN